MKAKEKPLHILQKRFVESLKGGKPFSSLGKADSPVLSSQNLGKIYRRNHFHALFQPLKDTYPGCHRLLGEKSFFLLSRIFILQYPSQDPLLLEYGDLFPSFLEKVLRGPIQGGEEKDSHLATLFPLLQSLANWEWAVKKGALLPPLQNHSVKAHLKDLKEGKDMQLKKNKACLLFCSPWTSLLAFWKELLSVRVGNPLKESSLQLEKKKQYLLLFKAKETLEVQNLHTKTFLLLKSFEKPQLLSQRHLQDLDAISVFLKKGLLILERPAKTQR